MTVSHVYLTTRPSRLFKMNKWQKHRKTTGIKVKKQLNSRFWFSRKVANIAKQNSSAIFIATTLWSIAPKKDLEKLPAEKEKKQRSISGRHLWSGHWKIKVMTWRRRWRRKKLMQEKSFCWEQKWKQKSFPKGGIEKREEMEKGQRVEKDTRKGEWESGEGMGMTRIGDSCERALGRKLGSI